MTELGWYLTTASLRMSRAVRAGSRHLNLRMRSDSSSGNIGSTALMSEQFAVSGEPHNNMDCTILDAAYHMYPVCIQYKFVLHINIT